MRNRTTPLAPLVRLSVVLLAVLAVLATGTGAATAAETRDVQTEAESLSFGLLGPVGLAAVALGVVGMALGVLRQRRKSQAAQRRVEEPTAEKPTLTPYRRSA